MSMAEPAAIDSAKRPSARLAGLDALRGIAALLVTLQHIFHLTGKPDSLFSYSYLAVDLFFMLSGFVMARSYEPRLASGMSVWRFGWIRLARLWPPMAIGACLGLLASHDQFAIDEALLLFTLGLFIVPALYQPDSVFPHNPPTWSILFELLANAAHALVLRFLGIGPLLIVAVASAAVLLGYSDTIAVGMTREGFWLGIPRVFFSYAVGIVIFRWLGERHPLPWWIGLVMFPALCIGNAFLPIAWRWLEMPAVFLLMPIVVTSGLARPRLLGPSLSWLGRISFPLYAVHFPVLGLLLKSGVDSVPIMLAVTLACAWLVSVLVERKLVGRALGALVQRLLPERSAA